MGLRSFRGIGMASAPVLSKQPSERLEGSAGRHGWHRRIVTAAEPLRGRDAEPTRLWSPFIRQSTFYIGNGRATTGRRQNATEAAMAAMIAL